MYNSKDFDIKKRSGVLPLEKALRDSIPKTPGVYVIREKDFSIIFINATKDIKKSIVSLLTGKDEIKDASYFDWYETKNITQAKALSDHWKTEYSSGQIFF